ncbi:MAG: sel1 repeat family protein [Chryseobacterium sp.]|nr:sel1 repeat family protein [Chryseobacterium sp.]
MKKLITICLMMAMGFASNAQQLSNYYDAVSDGRSGFSYTITVRIQKKSDNTYTATLLQVTPDSKGYYDALSGKLYTCSQLGNVCQPNNFGRLSITIRYESNGQEQVAGVFSFTGVNETVPLGMAITKGAIDGKPSDASNFKLELMGGTLTVSHTTEISDKISKLNNVTSSPSSNNNSSTNLPQETSEKTTSSYTKQEITNQVVAGVAGLAGELINDWNVSRERKLQQKKEDDKLRESKEAVESHNKRLENFKVEYLRLMDKAIKGDEDARMTLYFASEYLIEPEKLLPQREQWFEQALTNNNKYALLEKAFEAWSKSITTKNEKDDLLKLELGYLERAAAVGSSTALFKLGRIYDWNSSEKSGLDYFKKSAELGSFDAMYCLGMIYKYGRTSNEKMYDKTYYRKTYDVVLDEKVALEWFKKAIESNYKESLFPLSDSDYENKNKAFYELYLLYKKGKELKDKVKAKEMEAEAKIYEKKYYR